MSVLHFIKLNFKIMQHLSEYKSLFLIFSVLVIFSFAEEVFAKVFYTYPTPAYGYPTPYATPYGYPTPAYGYPTPYAYPTPAYGSQHQQ